MVMSTRVPAGTLNSVVCTHWPLGLLMKYDTQSGRWLTVFCASSWSMMWIVCPVLGVTPAVKSSVGGPASRKWATTNHTPATTATNATMRVVTRAGRDTSHHLASIGEHRVPD